MYKMRVEMKRNSSTTVTTYTCAYLDLRERK